MRRVTKFGGRVVVNTPGTIQPPFEKMARTLGDHIAPEAVGFVRAVFSMDDRAELEVLLELAGLDEVKTSGYSAQLDLPGPAELLWNYISLTPMAPIVAGCARGGEGCDGTAVHRRHQPARSWAVGWRSISR